MTRLLGAFFLAALCLIAQSGDTDATFTVARQTTGTSEKVTIQKQASGNRDVRLHVAYVYTSGACEITQSRNGTAATSAALTSAITGNNPESSSTSTLTAYHTSNVGAGTSIFGTIANAAGEGQTLNLSKIKLKGDGTNINYSLAVTCGASSTIRIVLMWDEF